MTTRTTAALLLTVLLACLAGRADAWVCTLPDSLTVDGDRLTLGQLSSSPVPSGAAGLNLLAGGQPNTTVTLDRKTVLRKLVTGGLAAGVKFRGAPATLVAFAGAKVEANALVRAMQEALAPLLPSAEPGAPATWFEVEYGRGGVGAVGPWRLVPLENAVLAPGRQQVRFRFEDDLHSEIIPVSVTVHRYGELATPVRRIEHDQELAAEMFTWAWADLAEGTRGRVVGRRALEGTCAARTLTPETQLLEQDIRSIPVVRTGDPVELAVRRGGVAVSVRAFARQDGTLGQTIPVRNELTGELVNARVVGPGSVEWRR
ncbi:MAG: flagellar basal body P-ring formation chaperone FlgA [Candidatus Krumholzibacteriia bacterium]